MNELIDRIQHIMAYYNLHRYELTEENEGYLIQQLHALSKQIGPTIKEVELCQTRKRALKRSIPSELIQN